MVTIALWESCGNLPLMAVPNYSNLEYIEKLKCYFPRNGNDLEFRHHITNWHPLELYSVSPSPSSKCEMFDAHLKGYVGSCRVFSVDLPSLWIIKPFFTNQLNSLPGCHGGSRVSYLGLPRCRVLLPPWTCCKCLSHRCHHHWKISGAEIYKYVCNEIWYKIYCNRYMIYIAITLERHRVKKQILWD